MYYKLYSRQRKYSNYNAATGYTGAGGGARGKHICCIAAVLLLSLYSGCIDRII